jgi:hypothetical protein
LDLQAHKVFREQPVALELQGLQELRDLLAHKVYMELPLALELQVRKALLGFSIILLITS